MAVSSVVKVLESVQNSYGLTRTLGELELFYRDDGGLEYHVGNSVVVLKIRHEGRWCAMRCYTRLSPHLAEIYGQRHLPAELYVYTAIDKGSWIDVVLEEWVEGITLRQSIEQAVASASKERLCELADAFDVIAAELLSSPWAHGDLTAENIIVTPAGDMHLIDFDCKYMPQLRWRPSPELGTAAYQPTTRRVQDFDAEMDDYSIALISTALRALSLDEELYHKYPFCDGLLFNPEDIAQGRCEVLERCCEMFIKSRMLAQYRIANMLWRDSLRIPLLRSIFHNMHHPATNTSGLQFSMECGYVGYTNSVGDVVIPYIYDDGLEFSEGVVMTLLAGVWYAVDESGQIVASFEGWERVKSLRGGVVRLLRDGKWTEHPLSLFN